MNREEHAKKADNGYKLKPVIGLFIFAVTILVYWPVRDFGFIHFDDPLFITENAVVQKGLTVDGLVYAFTRTIASNWHPLVVISHMADCRFFGLHAGYHHLVNALLHAANAVLLFLLLNQMTQAVWKSLFVALLFALHPLHVESVAWISERKDVLSTLWGLAALYSYAGYKQRKGRVAYLLTLLFFLCSLLSKPMLVTLPFLMLLMDYWPLKRLQPEWLKDWKHPQLRTVLREKVPFFLMILPICIITIIAQAGDGAVGSMAAYPVGTRVANALVAYAAYLYKMIYPVNLSFFYPHPGMPAEKDLAAALILLAVISGIAVSRARKSPFLAVGWLWYLGTLVPVIGLVQVGFQSMADRYTYIPLIGIFIMVAWGIPDLLGKKRKPWLVIFFLVPVICSTIFTGRQIQFWKNSTTLFGHALKITNNNFVAYNGLGYALAQQNKWAEAISYYQKAIQIAPDFPDVHFNAAVAYTKQRKFQNALHHYRKVLHINPNDYEVYNNIGNIWIRRGDLEKAADGYIRSLRINPEYPPARQNLEKVMRLVKHLKNDPSP